MVWLLVVVKISAVVVVVKCNGTYKNGRSACGIDIIMILR